MSCSNGNHEIAATVIAPGDPTPVNNNQGPEEKGSPANGVHFNGFSVSRVKKVKLEEAGEWARVSL